MEKAKKAKIIWVLEEISKDAKKDVEEAEGTPATGPNIAAFNGKQNAMIQALANILKEVISDGEV
jgi:hypothetical protein